MSDDNTNADAIVAVEFAKATAVYADATAVEATRAAAVASAAAATALTAVANDASVSYTELIQLLGQIKRLDPQQVQLMKQMLQQSQEQ